MSSTSLLLAGNRAAFILFTAPRASTSSQGFEAKALPSLDVLLEFIVDLKRMLQHVFSSEGFLLAAADLTMI